MIYFQAMLICYNFCYSLVSEDRTKIDLESLFLLLCVLQILSQGHSPWPQSCYVALQGGAAVLPFINGTGLAACLPLSFPC